MTDERREDPDSPLQPALGARLTGWKDIATYLDRGVRTAQRWEREFGLPVRRIGREGAESVFAFTTEIDQWLASSSAAHAKGQPAGGTDGDTSSGEGQHPEDGAPPATPTPTAAHLDHRRDRRWLWLLAITVGVLSAVGVWREWSARGPAAGPPADWRVEADTLVVVDADGRTVWTKTFDFAIDESYYESQPKATMGQVADLDRDGKREVLFVAYPANGNFDRAGLYLFNEDSTQRWTYQHRGIVTFGTVTMAGPWVVHRVFVTEDADRPGTLALWVISRDPAVFPTLLRRLDIATGQASGTYWSNGWINTLTLWRSPAGPRLLAGGVSNDQKGPSLAVLDANLPHARAPAEHDKYRCVTCLPVDPEAFLVFPKPLRFQASPGSGTVERFDIGSATTPMIVVVSYAEVPTGTRATAVMRLDADLRPLSADFADGYESVYDRLVKAGTIAPAGPIPQDAERELLPLLRWQNGRFVAVGKR
jgi:hypothetical protein